MFRNGLSYWKNDTIDCGFLDGWHKKFNFPFLIILQKQILLLEERYNTHGSKGNLKNTIRTKRSCSSLNSYYKFQSCKARNTATVKDFKCVVNLIMQCTTLKRWCLKTFKMLTGLLICWPIEKSKKRYVLEIQFKLLSFFRMSKYLSRESTLSSLKA